MVGKVACPCCHKEVTIEIEDIENVVTVRRKCSICGDIFYVSPSITFKVEECGYSKQIEEEQQKIDELIQEKLRIAVESAITSSLSELHFDGETVRFS